MTPLLDLFSDIQGFIESGGNILIWIAVLTFVMWSMIFERFLFYKSSLGKLVSDTVDHWEMRPERTSWNAHKIRVAAISRVSEKINTNLDLIGVMVTLCPLLGLLGTVTGMIEVFNVLAITGGGDAKSMAGGVSKATIPTMAGMVAALSGVFGSTYVINIAKRENQLLEDHLTMDH